jgi:hypothetical protein
VVIVLGLSWLLFAIPVLAFHGVIPGASLPVEIFALASTLLILLPMALWVTSITDGRPGVRALFARVFRWRFGIGWWLVVLFGLPAIALGLGLIFGGSLHSANLGLVLIKQTRRDPAGRRGDQFVGGNSVGRFLPNPVGGTLQLRGGRRCYGTAVRGCACPAALPR